MTDVSIIIVNYNTLGITADCIKSVVEKTQGIEYEIIVVDNASTDGSRDVFKSDSRLKYIYSQDNLGFGRANNLGLEKACGRNVLFLNSDTLLRNNAVKILSDYLDRHPDAGACGGNLFDADGNGTHSYKKYMYSAWSEIDNLLHCLPLRMAGAVNNQFNHRGMPLEVAYITGADMMLPRKVLEKTGGFNPLFFMYFEDSELCWRVAKAGYRIISVPDAEITHLEGGSTTKKKGFGTNDMYKESRRIFLELLYGKRRRKLIDLLSSDFLKRLFFVKR